MKRTLLWNDPDLESAWLTGRFQHADKYDPDSGDTFLIAVVNGVMHKINVTTDYSVEDISIPGDPNPPNLIPNWSVQGENFWILQDGSSLPIIFDGTTSRRANPADELKTGRMMEYYMGRIWIAQGRFFLAGDIVGGPSGIIPPNKRDAILKITENTYLAGGGVFTVPSNAGNITALLKTVNNDTALGEGDLLVFTRNTIYSVRVPPLRTAWAALTEPLQRIIMQNFGATSQDGVTVVNGDVFYRSKDGFRSLYMAKREFVAWGNTPVSKEVNRALERDDRALLQFGSSTVFDNRFLGTISPLRTNFGVMHRALAVLDFDLISSIGEKLPPAWDGAWTGLNVLKLVTGDFGGRDRCFAFVLNADYQIELWELTTAGRFDNEVNRIVSAVETARYDWNNPFNLKKLDCADLYLSRLSGTVHIKVQWRPDNYPCWIDWQEWDECAPKDACEDPNPPEGCFMFQDYREQYRTRLVVPQPPDTCDPILNAPFREFFEAQFRIEITGHARIDGFIAHCRPEEEAPYAR